MPRAKTLTQQVKELHAENKRLKRQLAQVSAARQKRTVSWRTPTIVVLAGVAGALLVAGNLVFWTARTLVDTNLYTDATQALIKKPAVQNAIADKTTKALFAKVNTTQVVEDALPPRLTFAAPSIAAQVETFTNKKARHIVASDRFEHVWTTVNHSDHKRFIHAVREYKGDGTINLSDVYTRLTSRLTDSRLAFLQSSQLPQNIGSIQVLDAPWLPVAHWVVVNLDVMRAVTISFFILLSMVTVVIAKQRRRVVMQLGLFYGVLMFATLVGLRVGEIVVVGDVTPMYQRTAHEAFQAVTQPFVLQTVGIMFVSFLTAFVMWFIGRKN